MDSGVGFHTYTNAHTPRNEPAEKWKSTLDQVGMLKHGTEDLDKKLLELQKLLSKMQLQLSAETSNFYSVSDTYL